jgi:CubicO group peptidase (beta-lactamase class C family)
MKAHGTCTPRFQLLRDAFEENFASRGEVGASVCVMVDGRAEADLWGGIADRATGRAWGRDTIGVVWSCTKGAVAACAHLLAARGSLDLSRPVAEYWPEFAAAGKGEVPVRWLLTHESALPAFREPLPPGALYDWGYMTGVLERAEPFWEPGSRLAYHASTFGHLVGEVIRRATGKGVGDFFRDELAAPWGLDFHLGLPESEEHRVAPTIRPLPLPPGTPPWPFLAAIGTGEVQTLTVRNTGRRPGDTDSREAHAACLPSGGGITNACGLAGLYSLFLRPEVFPPSLVREVQEVHSASSRDGTLLEPMRFGLGVMKSCPGLPIGREAFGHPGMGGSLGFCDPSLGMAFGYTMNRQGHGVLLNERGRALVRAAYECLTGSPT